MSEASPAGPGSPFPITIGPERAVAHRGWREARERALAAVSAGPGLVLVLGPAGTGKSLLLQEIARTLRAGGEADVLLQLRGDLPVDAVGVEAAREQAARDGAGRRRRVVLIDEADRMNEAALERLGRLGACTVVLAGTADPGDEPPGEASAAVVVRLAALPPDEVGAFVAARLAQAGLRADLLSGEAMARLAECSGGVPRLLNILAGAALFLASAERAPRVEAEHVSQAAALRDGGDAEIGAAAPPRAPVVPGVAPRRRDAAEPVAPAPATAAFSPVASSGTGGQAPLGNQHRRRYGRAALSCAAAVAAAGIAAACGWLVLWPGEHARQASLTVAAAVSPAVPAASVPVASTPAGSGAAAVSPPPVATPAEVAGAAPAERAVKEQVAQAAPAPMPEVPPPAPSVAPAAAPAGATATAPVEVEAALPSGAPAHVVLRYVRGSADAAARAGRLALTLRAAGFPVDGAVAVAGRDAKPGARFFFAEDRDAAEAVLRAARLPGKGVLAEAAGLDALPRPGLVELAVPPPGQLEAGGRRQPPDDGRS